MHFKTPSNNQSGAIMTEFLVIVPFLTLLFYAAHFINQKIEDRLALEVAVRNLNVSDSTEAEGLLKSIKRDMDIHGALHSSKKNDAEVKDGRLTYGNYQFSIESSEVTYGDIETDPKAKRIKHETKVNKTGSYGVVSDLSGKLGASGTKVIDEIKNFKLGGDAGRFFYKDEPKQIKVRMKVHAGAGLFNKGYAAVSDYIYQAKQQKKLKDGIEFNFVHQNHYRLSAGYLDHTYQYQAIVGFFLGDMGDLEHWSRPEYREDEFKIGADSSVFRREVADGFVAECMMHFVANSDCLYEPQNWFSMVIRLIGDVKGIIQFIYDIVSFGEGFAQNLAMREVLDEMIDAMAKEMAEEVVDAMKEEMDKELQDQLKDKGFDQIKNKISDELEKEFEDILKQSKGTLNSQKVTE